MLSMSAASDDLAYSETSEQWTEPDEQGLALLNNEKDQTHVDKTRQWSIEWWHFALVFIVSASLLVPFTLNLAPKGLLWKKLPSNDSTIPESISEPQGDAHVPKDEYLLDPEWNFDAAPTTREYSWTLTETDWNPDGVYRTMLLINKQFPGPLIEVNEFDTVRVTVHNQMTNATSIHWHGLYQNGSNIMDGTVGVTQCPIAAGHSFTYEFVVRGQSGTYWYHAHQGVQASDGLVGPFIIHSKDEKQLQRIPYVSDRIIMLSDHYHDLTGALARKYLAPDMENSEPVPDGALINGRAIRNCDDLKHRTCDNTTANVGLPVFDFEPNQHHRLRIINVGAFAEFEFQIDEHELAVTEADGTDVRPITYHRLNINPAQRYSVVVQTNASEKTSFRMRARMITHCFAEENPFMAGTVEGVVRYNKLPAAAIRIALPDTIDWGEALQLECKDLNTTDLVPVKEIAAPAKPDALFYIRSNFEIGAYRLSRGFFNTSSWRPNVKSPSLFRAMDGLKTKNSSFVNSQTTNPVFVNDNAFDKPTEFVIQSSGIKTIDILISNFDDGNHPMHLHGYKYWVLAQGHGYPARKSLDGPMDDLDNLSPLYDSLDLSNPMRRDTASVEAFGWALIRFVADNPGAWNFHCHISWHTEAGLAMQFLTRTDLLANMEISEAHRALCAADGLERGMGPKDEIYYDEA